MTKHLNSRDNKDKTGKKITCWFCGIHSNPPHDIEQIVDEYGCCKRCGTNLKKYLTRASHRYPNMSHLEEEVLGFVDKIDVSDSAKEENDW